MDFSLTQRAVASQQAIHRSVLLVGNFLSAAGGSRGVCEDLCTRLQAASWNVITVSDKENRLLRLADMVRTAWQKRREYEVAQVDVYSGPAFFWAEAVCWTLRRAKKSYILTLRGGNLPSFARRWPSRVWRLLRSASVVTTPSRYLFEQMQPYRSDLSLLPNPLDIRQYPFRLRHRPMPQLVWLRSFHSIYNPSLAPRVIALLVQKFPHIHLTMIGPDKGDASLQEVRRLGVELGVTKHITIIKGVPKQDVPMWLSRGDIFINTTNVDNTPVSVMEAMACGLCIVSTNVGGIPYLVDHEHDALLVPPDDPTAMATAIRRALTEPGLAARLSQHGRHKIEECDWSFVLPQWEALLSIVAQD